MLLRKNLSEVLNTNSLLLLFVFIRNSNVRPVPLILFSFNPLTKDAPSKVPIEKPTLKEPVWISSIIISMSWRFSSISVVSTATSPINFNLFNCFFMFFWQKLLSGLFY